uniref:Cytokinin riboside 5'-monophosphate phosphoribohydrolase n=1 Tax=Pinguiococcus pyrenoidosus TaxID=172671 RepID=A0A7R9Y8D8_9STRA
MRICVYGSSSDRTPKVYTDAAFHLGQLVAKGGHVLVNGGGRNGVMGAMNDGAKSANGQIVAVIHERFVVDSGVAYHDVDEMVVCGGDDLQRRKKMLMDRSDCLIVAPGGLGTLDEFCEVLCNLQLSFVNMPVAILNTNGFYDDLLRHIKKCKEQGLLMHDINDLVYVAKTPEDALEYLSNASMAEKQDLYQQKRVRPRFWICSLAIISLVELGIIGYLLRKRA